MKLTDDMKKLLVLGDSQSGRTNLLTKIELDDIPEFFFNTYGYNRGVSTRETIVDGTKVTLVMFDSNCSYEDFYALRRLIYPHIDVVLICFAIDNPESLENVRAIWHPEIKRHLTNLHYLLIGTKVDLRNDNAISKEKVVTYEDGLEMSKNINANGYFECSVKNGMGIKEIREASARLSLKFKKKTNKKPCSIL